MKKIALFVSVLLVAGSLFAADPVFEAKPGISGDATLTFGINLDGSVASGFANASSTNITLGLINKDSNEKGGKEGEEVYGWIKLKDFELKIDGGEKYNVTDNKGPVVVAKPGIEAKLFLGPVYINILGTDKAADKAGNISESVLAKAVDAVAQNPADEFEGIAIGLKDTSVVDLTIGASTKFDWDANSNKAADAVVAKRDITYKAVLAGYTLATNEMWVDTSDASGFSKTFSATTTASMLSGTPAVTMYQVAVFGSSVAAADAGTPTANTTNVYNFYVAAALKAVPDLIAEVAANMTTDNGYTVGAGVKLGYGIAVAEGIKITPTVAFDLKNAAALTWQLTGDLFVSFPGDKKKVEFVKKSWDGNKDNEVEYSPGFEVKYTMDSASTSNMDLGVYAWDGSLIPVLDVVAAFELTKLGQANAQLMGLGLNVGATIDVLSPFAKFVYKQTAVTPAAAETKLEVGVDIKAITNTTFTLKYASGDLSASTVGLGVITFATKIAY